MIFFLAFSNTNFQFGTEKLTCRSYIVVEVLSTTSWVELINKSEFAKVALDKNSGIFVVHVVVLEAEMSIYLLKIAQIATLQENKALPKFYLNTLIMMMYF